MSEKHTPGPWIAKEGLGRWNVTTSTGPRTHNICAINNERIEQEANARLIAAAPDLLLSLAWLLDIEGRTDRETVTEERPLALAAARKAIAAIKGGAQ